MKRVRCCLKEDHEGIDLHSKKCAVCKAPLEKLCEGCDKFANYSNFRVHKKACDLKRAASIAPLDAVAAPAVQKKRVRFAFLASAWKYEEGEEHVGPLGQYCGVLPAGFPKSIRRKEIADPSGDNSFVDFYDALWGSLALDADFELVHVFHSLDNLIRGVRDHELDLLVVGDWIYPLLEKNDQKQDAEKMYAALWNLELDHSLRVFPPLEYVWYFAHKACFLTRLAKMPLNPQLIKPIPTLPVSMGHFWKPEVVEFAGASQRVVLKREFSDRGRHVKEMDVNSLTPLEGRDSFRWIAQPFLTEFAVNPEMRMYVIEGKCTFGCMTSFVYKEDGSSHMSVLATAPGRNTWTREGGKEAAAAAEHVVQVLGREQAHVLRFIRVDLVRRNDGSGGWWLNELEYFGNAHILLEVFDNAPELLQLILTATKSWIKEAVIFY